VTKLRTYIKKLLQAINHAGKNDDATIDALTVAVTEAKTVAQTKSIADAAVHLKAAVSKLNL
jgi:ribosomal protein S20